MRGVCSQVPSSNRVEYIGFSFSNPIPALITNTLRFCYCSSAPKHLAPQPPKPSLLANTFARGCRGPPHFSICPSPVHCSSKHCSPHVGLRPLPVHTSQYTFFGFVVKSFANLAVATDPGRDRY